MKFYLKLEVYPWLCPGESLASVPGEEQNAGFIDFTHKVLIILNKWYSTTTNPAKSNRHQTMGPRQWATGPVSKSKKYTFFERNIHLNERLCYV